MVNFIIAVTYHFCPSLPAASTQPGASTLADLCTKVGLRCCSGFGEFYYCCCLPLLPQPAWSILATWCIEFSRSLYSSLTLVTVNSVSMGNFGKSNNHHCTYLRSPAASPTGARRSCPATWTSCPRRPSSTSWRCSGSGTWSGSPACRGATGRWSPAQSISRTWI